VAFLFFYANVSYVENPLPMQIQSNWYYTRLGDLACLPCESRKFFRFIEEEFRLPGLGKMSITTSNDLNEETLDALNKQVNLFGY
jgi:hypothetical protein